MIKKIETSQAPLIPGPYSQAVSVNGIVYVSGQLPVDPKTGSLVEADIKTQTTRVLMNVKAVLEAAGLGLDRVTRCEVFLKDMSDFSAMNEVYASFFDKEPMPARQAFQVGALPLDAMVEISCIAHSA